MLANSEHLPGQNVHSFVFRWLHITLHVDLETIFGYLSKLRRSSVLLGTVPSDPKVTGDRSPVSPVVVTRLVRYRYGDSRFYFSSWFYFLLIWLKIFSYSLQKETVEMDMAIKGNKVFWRADARHILHISHRMPRWDATHVDLFSFLEFWIFDLLFMDKHSFPFCGKILSHLHVC